MRFCEPAEAEDQEEAKESDHEMDIDSPSINSAAQSSSANSDEFVGKLVAALTLTTEGTEEWILARVCACREDGELFEVEDAEIEGEPEEKE